MISPLAPLLYMNVYMYHIKYQQNLMVLANHTHNDFRDWEHNKIDTSCTPLGLILKGSKTTLWIFTPDVAMVVTPWLLERCCANYDDNDDDDDDDDDCSMVKRNISNITTTMIIQW
jgi:hypothetical protein